MRIKLFVAASSIATTCIMNPAVAGGLSFQPVALSGQPAPGAPGRVFSFYYPPSIGSSGQVVFPGWLTGLTSNDEGLWSGLPGSVQLVAREGSAAPGTTGVFGQNSFTSKSCVNSSGVVAFSASLTGSGIDGTNNTGIWAGVPGSVGLVARAGDPAPGTPPGVVFAGALQNWLMLNDAGQLVHRGALTGTGVDSSNDYGIWAGTPGALQLVAREGDVAPGTDGALFGPFATPINPVINAVGEVVFAADYGGGRGIWRWSGGVLELVTRTGSSAYGMSGTFDYVFDPWMNASGSVVFLASVAGEGIDFTNNRGIWSGEPGEVELVVRKGNPAPGSPGNYLVLNSDNVGLVSIDDGGFVTFPSSLMDENGAAVAQLDGIWQYEGPGISWAGSNLVLEGTPAPGLPFVTLDSVGALGPHPTSSMPFTATLAGTGVTPSNNASLWLKDVGSPPALVVRAGDMIDIGGGVMQTISGISASNSAPSYNASRQLVIGLSFTNNTSGIFAANVPGPPIPGDIDGDGDIDDDDYNAFADGFGSSSGDANFDPYADMDGDGDVDCADLRLFRDAWPSPPFPPFSQCRPTLGSGGLRPPNVAKPAGDACSSGLLPAMGAGAVPLCLLRAPVGRRRNLPRRLRRIEQVVRIN